MNFTYSIRVCRDGKARIGRECVPPDRFKERLNENRNMVMRTLDTPCWEWTGSKSNKRGYGTVMYQRKPTRVSRLSWILYNGDIPESMEVCHRCDNPPCFNPDHLFLGTHADNIRDAFSKGRIPIRRGEDHGMVKLTEQQVIEIRDSYKLGGISQKELGLRYGVAQSAIWCILKRKVWKHI